MIAFNKVQHNRYNKETVFLSVISLVLLFVSNSAPGKVIVLPYILFIVFNKKPSSFIPLLILGIGGTMNTYIIICCFILLTLFNLKTLYKIPEIRIILTLSLAILPIILYTGFYQYYYLGMSIPLICQNLSFYFAIYPFFYGILIASNIKFKFFSHLNLFFIIVVIIQLFSPHTIRLIFFIIPYFLIVITSAIYHKRKETIPFLFLYSMVFIYFLTTFQQTFTLLFSIFYSLLILILYKAEKIFTVSILRGIAPFIVIVFMLYFGSHNYQKYSVIDADINTMTNINEFKAAVANKFYADRAEFWEAGINQIFETPYYLPPPIIKNIVITRGNNNMEITFGSHTLFIELIRYLGWICGLIVGFIFISMTILSNRILSKKGLRNIFLPSIIAITSTSIIGSLTGSYPLSAHFSICTLSLGGLCFALYKKRLTS